MLQEIRNLYLQFSSHIENAFGIATTPSQLISFLVITACLVSFFIICFRAVKKFLGFLAFIVLVKLFAGKYTITTKSKQAKKKPKPDSYTSNKNDNLARERERETVQEKEKVQMEYYNNTKFQEDEKIVGIAQPVGFWTGLVMKQKFALILNNLSLKTVQDKGYWQAYIEARDKSGPAKDKGMGV